MKPPLRWLLRLYPPAWRQRYGDEFETLLHDTGSSWQQLPDILTEALKMRIAAANWKLLISFALGGLVLAFAGSFGLPETYVSTAVAEVALPPGATPEDAIRHIRDLSGKTLSRISLSNIISSPGLDLYRKERQSQPLEDVIANMKARDLKIELIAQPHGNAQVFAIRFLSHDRFAAQTVVQKVLSRMAEENRTAPSQMALAVLDPPDLPVHSISPNRNVIAVLGLIAGLVAGGLFAWRRGRSPNAG